MPYWMIASLSYNFIVDGVIVALSFKSLMWQDSYAIFWNSQKIMEHTFYY